MLYREMIRETHTNSIAKDRVDRCTHQQIEGIAYPTSLADEADAVTL